MIMHTTPTAQVGVLASVLLLSSTDVPVEIYEEETGRAINLLGGQLQRGFRAVSISLTMVQASKERLSIPQRSCSSSTMRHPHDANPTLMVSVEDDRKMHSKRRPLSTTQLHSTPMR